MNTVSIRAAVTGDGGEADQGCGLSFLGSTSCTERRRIPLQLLIFNFSPFFVFLVCVFSKNEHLLDDKYACVRLELFLFFRLPQWKQDCVIGHIQHSPCGRGDYT